MRSGEVGQFVRARECQLQYWQCPLKKPLNPVFYRALSFAMATKKSEQLNRFPAGVCRDAKKDKKLQMA